MSTNLRELEILLSVSPAHVRAWETAEFDRLSQARELVLMGAGGLGRRTLAGLRKMGVEPLAFADNRAGGQGPKTLEGIPVLAPDEAAEKFGRRACFVVTIWGANSPHRYAHSRAQLTALGCDCVCPFPPLFWKFSAALLPFYLQDLPSRVIEARSDVRRCFDLWQDEASKAEYVSQVRLRLQSDFDALSHPVAHQQYLPDDLFHWSADESIIDGGAFNGDSIRAISAKYGSRFGHILALEPDPANFIRLSEAVQGLPPEVSRKIDVRQVALGARAGTLYLEATATAASSTSSSSGSGSIAVNAERLDTLVAHSSPSFIKLDIEGAEIDAIDGARDTIQRDAPILAVCVYHAQDHLWRIPLMLAELRHDYALYLRPHNEEGWDLVCYAVPASRLIAGGA